MKNKKIAIIGCAGKMGRMLIHEVLSTPGCELADSLEHDASPFLGHDLGELIGRKPVGRKVLKDKQKVIHGADICIDFSSPANTLECCEIAANAGRAYVIGTTGITNEQKETLKKFSKLIPIMQSANMSLGVNVLLSLVERVAASLDEQYDIEILEMHHNRKVDAPSGTALALGEAAAKGRNDRLENLQILSREGITGARQQGKIGFATLRGGDVVGDHTVMFATEGERIEITHKASDRAIFARGAVRATLWISNQKAGLYSMQDVLGI
jgi:4-hydroxy-tetrahydrodipicolinate reductase